MAVCKQDRAQKEPPSLHPSTFLINTTFFAIPYYSTLRGDVVLSSYFKRLANISEATTARTCEGQVVGRKGSAPSKYQT